MLSSRVRSSRRACRPGGPSRSSTRLAAGRGRGSSASPATGDEEASVIARMLTAHAAPAAGASTRAATGAITGHATRSRAGDGPAGPRPAPRLGATRDARKTPAPPPPTLPPRRIDAVSPSCAVRTVSGHRPRPVRRRGRYNRHAEPVGGPVHLTLRHKLVTSRALHVDSAPPCGDLPDPPAPRLAPELPFLLESLR
jgi:hypothetical protein